MTTNVPIIKLNNGQPFPAVGLGTFKGQSTDEELAKAVTLALDAGYRHFDTAYAYRTEAAVGKAVREHPTVPRDQVVVVSKLWQTFHRPDLVQPAFDRTMENLGLEYLDVYMMHWPMAWKFRGFEFDQLTIFEDGDVKCEDIDFVDTWRAMEDLVKIDGRVKSLGVSNFTIPMLEKLLASCDIVPAVHEFEIHPANPNEEMIEFCRKKGIAVSAYSPLANPGMFGKNSLLEDPRIVEMAEKYSLTPAQLALSWGITRGYAVIPKSATPSRIEQNIKLVKLSSEDVDAITKIGMENPAVVCNPRLAFGPSNNIFNK
ncbi:Aldo/keto reductase [Hesseltinella vesiculosa]|uniref:Aldo/keto reductase n=1 Tax=Hesseltinella vesiculosa TaxID=101127 RepID=A0A1X2G6C4_9FUNG|nr:Aldo/keto reductase [Hesseltinella vesiculosa]